VQPDNETTEIFLHYVANALLTEFIAKRNVSPYL